MNSWPPEAHSKDAVKDLNATIGIFQNETLLTSTDAPTVRHPVCVNETHGPDVPIKVGNSG